MTCWICVTTRENWWIIKEKNVWGVPSRSKKVIESVKKGDKLVFYVIQSKEDDEIQPSRIVGVYEAVSESYYDDTPLFESYKGKVFPYRIKIKPIKIAKTPIVFKNLVDKLSFIRNKRYWTVYFRRAMFEIPYEDFEKIMRELE